MLVPDSEHSEDTATLERPVRRPPGRCNVVSVPAGGVAVRLSVPGGCVLEAAVGVFAVDSSGRLCPCPAVPPAARTEPGECSGVN